MAARTFWLKLLAPDNVTDFSRNSAAAFLGDQVRSQFRQRMEIQNRQWQDVGDDQHSGSRKRSLNPFWEDTWLPVFYTTSHYSYLSILSFSFPDCQAFESAASFTEQIMEG